MQANLTPSFDARFRALSAASCDVVSFRGRRGQRYTARGVDPARRALSSLSAASDVHSIACGNEICPGDQILFVATVMVADMGGSRFRSGMSRRSFHMREADVLTSDPGPTADYDLLTIRYPNGEIDVMSAEILAINGIWRARWDDEDQRDRLLGIADTRRAIAQADHERHGAEFFARDRFGG